MANNNFVVKNGITVNGSFTANSTTVNAAAITATSVNATSLFTGGVSVNTMITGNAATSYANAVANSAAIYQTTVGLSANVAKLSANNSTNLNGQAASYYTNIPARLGYTPANKAGETFTGLVGATAFVTDTNQPYYMRNDGAVYMLWDGTNVSFNQSVSTSGAMTSAGGYYTATNAQVAGAVYSDVIRDNSSGKNTGFNLEDAAISLYINNSLGGYMDSAGSWNIAGTFYSYSDRNLKNNIVPRNSNTSIVDVVEPVSYERIERPGITEVGFIAQDVQTVFPEAVKLLDVPGRANGVLSIAPIPLIAQLWTELRETRTLLRELQNRLSVLEAK